MGDLLVALGLLGVDELLALLDVQQRDGGRLVPLLADAGLVDPQVIARSLAEHLELPLADLRHDRPSPSALGLIGEDDARNASLVPLRIADDVLEVAAADPLSRDVTLLLSSLPVGAVKLLVAPIDDVRLALDTHYRLLSSGDDDVRLVWERSSPSDTGPVVTAAPDTPVVRLVDSIVAQAVRDRASDVHLEPSAGRLRVRFRIDGALCDVLSLPQTIGPEMVSRIKVLAGMDIVEHRRPQDGQFQTVVSGHTLDVRVATAATIWGETAVLRLLDTGRTLTELEELGLPEAAVARYRAVIRRPYGMILCSGPTGSGKTTTLYATLAEVRRSELNVVTIEDPVEYIVPEINQMQIHPQAGVTFAVGLRSILRQDPDVILVGEIRDEETASIAVSSALTGHLVMSSLHAIDATSSVYRLIDMGIEPFLVASSVVGVVGQRLVRRVCARCRVAYRPAPHDVDWFVAAGGRAEHEFVRGDGCNFCAGTGFRERVGIFEVLEMTDELSTLLVAGATPRHLREAARRSGMRTMADEAVDAVTEGATTLEEVVRAVHRG
ncbi:MAG: hypothetical protein RI958_3077 [Actinomycetota bacterium]